MKGGPLARLAGIWINSPSFQAFAVRQLCDIGLSNLPPCPIEVANNYILNTCGIDSKKELDHNTKAAWIFHQEIRKPYLNYQQRKNREKAKL